jgi:hypothetical protein
MKREREGRMEYGRERERGRRGGFNGQKSMCDVITDGGGGARGRAAVGCNDKGGVATFRSSRSFVIAGVFNIPAFDDFQGWITLNAEFGA